MGLCRVRWDSAGRGCAMHGGTINLFDVLAFRIQQTCIEAFITCNEHSVMFVCGGDISRSRHPSVSEDDGSRH